MWRCSNLLFRQRIQLFPPRAFPDPGNLDGVWWQWSPFYCHLRLPPWPQKMLNGECYAIFHLLFWESLDCLGWGIINSPIIQECIHTVQWVIRFKGEMQVKTDGSRSWLVPHIPSNFSSLQWLNKVTHVYCFRCYTIDPIPPWLLCWMNWILPVKVWS